MKPLLIVALALATVAQSQTPLMPLTAETRVTTNADGAVSAQSVERIQLKDGQSAEWRKSASLTRETKPGCAETTETIVQSAIQGQPAQTIQRTTSREKTDSGETIRISEVTRNALGKDVGQRVVEETAQRQPDGTTSVRVVEQGLDARGQLAVQREEQRRIREQGATQTVIENQIRTYDHLRGRFDVTAIQTTDIRKQGDTTRTETTIRRAAGDQNRIVGRVQTTETKTAGGAVQREIVEYGQGLYDKISALSTGELKPKRKIVERRVQNPDGSSSLTREVFRLDVNGDWKPVPPNWVGDTP